MCALAGVLGLGGCATRDSRPRTPAPPPATPGPARPPVDDREAERPGRPPAPGTVASAGLTMRIEVGARGSGVIQAIDLETYVRDVVVGELAVARTDGALVDRAYEAQAIVARTYALAGRRRHAAEGFDLCSTTHCQVFVRDQWRQSRWADAVDRAVQRTRGRYLAYGQAPIEAVFHAQCGGHTSTAAQVWRSAGAPYLIGVRDEFCLRERPTPWSTTLSLEDVRIALNQTPRTAVGDRLDAVQVLTRDAGGRVVAVALTGSRSPVVTAEDFRLALLRHAGARSLPSARFDVQREGTRVTFTGTGSGHGVGLCQIGLIGRLRAGASAEDALLAYYPGATIRRS